MNLQKYSAYKDSGVDWLGEVPEHWEVKSNKFIFKIKKNQVGKNSEKYVLLSLTLNGIIKRDMENPQGKFPAEFNTYQEVEKGDFIFCLFDVEETPRTIGLSEYDGMITGAYTVMKPETDFNKKFLYYFYLNLDSDKRMKPLYTGLRNTIAKDAFLSFKTFLPPLPEQTAIAAFLDRKTALIDQAIGIKQKQIELLKERRQIIIHQAVTRGLDPTVKMKDSGVEWIGEVPEVWEVKKVKYLFRLIGGGTPSKERKDYWGGDIPWVSPKDMKTDYIVTTEDYVTNKGLINSSSNLIESNTLLMVVRSGILQRTIPVAISKVGLTINQDMKAFVPNGLLSTEYFFYYVKGNDIYLKNDWVKQGATVESVEAELLRNSIVPIPPIEEQIKIVNMIVTTSQKTSTAIALKQQEIEKLKEYKATLINSAVTGKIKVN